MPEVCQDRVTGSGGSINTTMETSGKYGNTGNCGNKWKPNIVVSQTVLFVLNGDSG